MVAVVLCLSFLIQVGEKENTKQQQPNSQDLQLLFWCIFFFFQKSEGTLTDKINKLNVAKKKKITPMLPSKWSFEINARFIFAILSGFHIQPVWPAEIYDP